jgi:hypothetical protein
MLDTFIVSAPEGHWWPLEITAVGQRLRERFPEMRSRISHAPALGRDYLGFEIALAGTWRIGAYHGGGPLILNDGDAADWAPTIARFLGLLPARGPAVVMRESNPEHIAPLPPDPSPAQIQQVLESTLVD